MNGFASDGFDYRTAYFRDFDGAYYNMKISIGVNDNGKEAYNIGNIEKASFPVNGSKAIRKNASDTKIPQPALGVNSYSMQESQNDSKQLNLDHLKELADEHGAIPRGVLKPLSVNAGMTKPPKNGSTFPTAVWYLTKTLWSSVNIF